MASKIWTFKVKCLCQKTSESFHFFFNEEYQFRTTFFVKCILFYLIFITVAADAVDDENDAVVIQAATEKPNGANMIQISCLGLVMTVLAIFNW